MFSVKVQRENILGFVGQEGKPKLLCGHLHSEREDSSLPLPQHIPVCLGGLSRVVGPLHAQLPIAGDNLLKKEPHTGKTGKGGKGLTCKR